MITLISEFQKIMNLNPNIETTQEISVSIAEITNALDAMYWCISPYLDDSDLSDYPWIVSLIQSYNSLVNFLPSPYNLQYEPIEF